MATVPTTLRPLSRSIWSSAKLPCSRMATRVSPASALMMISLGTVALAKRVPEREAVRIGASGVGEPHRDFAGVFRTHAPEGAWVGRG